MPRRSYQRGFLLAEAFGGSERCYYDNPHYKKFTFSYCKITIG
ncbi:hypothetical protein LINPERHAP1_LOCUS34141 [Linum perenne]